VLSLKLGWNVLVATVFWVPGLFFNSCVQERSPQQMQTTPGWLSFKSDQVWHSLSLSWTSKIQLKREEIRLSLIEYKKKHQLEAELLEPAKTETATQGTYGQLPEVYVDQGQGAIFPFPISKPNRFSWYQTAVTGWDLLRKLDRLESHISSANASVPTKKDFKKEREKKFESLTTEWNEINSYLITLAQQVRYLLTWQPLLLAEQKENLEKGRSPASETLVQSIFQCEQGDRPENQRLLDSLRASLRPHRIVKQRFLPEHLEEVPAGIITVPITTDIRDKKFLAEIEGALITHWNQSSWANNAQISFHIRWKFLKPNSNFAAKKETILQHLSHFPSNAAILTTGGISTHVSGPALILGPGKITPRTLAHELGHLLGFNDCYLRTLTGQGVFGLAVLEWDSPFYPDDIMCDNTYGEPRVEVW
jgi:hypothetical protein